MQTALWPALLGGGKPCSNGTDCWGLSDGVPTHKDQFFVTDPANLAVYFSADGDIAMLRNVVMFRMLCFRMPLCKLQTCYNSKNNNNNNNNNHLQNL